MERFAEKLVRELERSGHKQSWLVRKTGLSQSTVSDLMNGLRRPALDQAFSLARALEVPLDYLADDAAEELPRPITSDERSLLGTFRGSGLTIDEATARLYRGPEQSGVRKPSQG